MNDRIAPAYFQEVAIKHIVSRLRDRKGSRRFLLADEVGLGKTIVAAGVISEMKCKRVLYLCSNTTIAEQNRPKLVSGPDAVAARVSRVTELALQNGEPAKVMIYAFTPGTSLGGGTGLAWERRLMLFMLRRIYRSWRFSRGLRDYFRGSVHEETWRADTRRASLRNEFSARRPSRSLQAALRKAWTKASMMDELRKDLREQCDCNRIVGKMREELQRVALQQVQPDLVILDEVQRFRDILDPKNKKLRLAQTLFQRRIPVLILSATPYRLLTLDHEAEKDGSHHEDFFRTLEFLFGKNSEIPLRIRANLEAFREKLPEVVAGKDRERDALRIKRDLETDLRQVMCRTERNLYAAEERTMEDKARVSSDDSYPNRQALREFFDLQRALGRQFDSQGQLIEFWKSAPSVLSFLDAGYAAQRRIRASRASFPATLVAPPTEMVRLVNDHQRMRALVRVALGDGVNPPPLWTPPSFAYHHDSFFRTRESRKLLVFSGWRFVPKAIAIVASRVVEQRLRSKGKDTSQPLRFSDTRSFHVFDVCYPSPALADLLNPRAFGLGRGQKATARDILIEAESRLRKRLGDVGVEIVPQSRTPMWQAAARLETSVVASALEHVPLPDELDPENAERHFDEYRAWIPAKRRNLPALTLSKARLRQLALIAVSSPAVSLLRALRSVYDCNEERALADIIGLCADALRRYFNKPMTQRAIRGYHSPVRWRTSAHGYARRVLDYTRDAHLQAVLDEHGYLLRNVGGCPELTDALAHFKNVWLLVQGTPKTNGTRKSRSGHRLAPDQHSHYTHFALAFGEDSSRDPSAEKLRSASSRATALREAFNSPFWPFVLATTSVGQEGLDFHLYCRDVMHWNLPTNPVDLEQREGRVNRRDGLAIRSAIAADVKLEELDLAHKDANPWTEVFRVLGQRRDKQRYKHGLYPHWLYERRDSDRLIRRHVAYFSTSRDAQRYERLQNQLYLYRLVFGQPDQQDLLAAMEEKLNGQNIEHQLRRLRGYMLNLSPVTELQARQRARCEARELLESGSVPELVSDIEDLIAAHPKTLGTVSGKIRALIQFARTPANDNAARRAQQVAVGALAYLRDPYDHVFDEHIDSGFDDDLEVVERASARLVGSVRKRRRMR